jgi:hypothetical protein
LRGEAWRALPFGWEDPDAVAAQYGEYGFAAPPGEDLPSPRLFLLALVRLLEVAASGGVHESHLYAGQLGRILDWPTKPTLSDRTMWHEIDSMSWLRSGGFDLPELVVDVVWHRAGSTDVTTKRWAAATWALCNRQRPALNELSVLLGDQDSVVRAAGVIAMREVDRNAMEEGWLAARIDRFLREDAAESGDVIDYLGSAAWTPEVLEVAGKVLDEGRSDIAFEYVDLLASRLPYLQTET